MPDTQALSIYQIVRDGGLIGCLIFFIYGGWKQWWVWGYTLTRERLLVDEMRAEREEWKRLALKSTAIADRAVDHAAVIQRGAA
jgi:hypothetical protein